MDLGSGITFDIFTHVFTWVVFKNFIKIYTYIKNTSGDLDEGYNGELKRMFIQFSDKYGQMRLKHKGGRKKNRL